jgi:hypothetical protein
MPLVHMASSFEEAKERGKNVKMFHSPSHTWAGLNPFPGEFEFESIGWTYETHHGVCLFEREYNGYHDSDFYMTIWNHEKQEPESIQFATTRGWSYPCYASRADATPEVKAAYAVWEAKRHQAAAEARERERALRPEKGKNLRVVRGRKVPRGTTGVCIWRGSGQWGERVGLKDSSGTVHWTSIKNVEVVS